MKSFVRSRLYLLPLIVFAVMFGVNVASLPSLSDDILYEYYYPKHPVQGVPHGVVKEHPIGSFQDINESIYHHYLNMNGRAPVHYAVQLFCGFLGKIPFGILQAIFLVLFSIICCKIVGCEKRSEGNWLLLMPVFLLLLFFVEPDVWMGIAGGINYLWSSVLCLSFWRCLTKYKEGKPVEVALLCLLSFIAGWSHEGIVIPLSLACISYYFRNARTFTKTQYAMLACWVFGASLLVFAPSNFNRAGESVGWTFKSLLRLFSLMGCFYVMCVFLLVLLLKSKTEAFSFIRDNMDLFIGIVGGIALFSLVSNKPVRIVYGIELLSVVISCKLLACLIKRENIRRFVGVGVSCFALLGMGFWMYYQQRSNEQIEELFSQLEDPAKNDGIYILKDFDAPSFLSAYLIRCVSSPNPMYDYWNQKVLSWKYEKPIACIVESKDKLTKIPGDNDFWSWGNYWSSEKKFPPGCIVRYRFNYKFNFKYRLIGLVKRVLKQDVVPQEKTFMFEDVQRANNMFFVPMNGSKVGVIEEVIVIDNL